MDFTYLYSRGNSDKINYMLITHTGSFRYCIANLFIFSPIGAVNPKCQNQRQADKVPEKIWSQHKPNALGNHDKTSVTFGAASLFAFSYCAYIPVDNIKKCPGLAGTTNQLNLRISSPKYF
jgi:hypothetical protein